MPSFTSIDEFEEYTHERRRASRLVNIAADVGGSDEGSDNEAEVDLESRRVIQAPPTVTSDSVLNFLLGLINRVESEGSLREAESQYLNLPPLSPPAPPPAPSSPGLRRTPLPNITLPAGFADGPVAFPDEDPSSDNYTHINELTSAPSLVSPSPPLRIPTPSENPPLTELHRLWDNSAQSVDIESSGFRWYHVQCLYGHDKSVVEKIKKDLEDPDRDDVRQFMRDARRSPVPGWVYLCVTNMLPVNTPLALYLHGMSGFKLRPGDIQRAHVRQLEAGESPVKHSFVLPSQSSAPPRPDTSWFEERVQLSKKSLGTSVLEERFYIPRMPRHYVVEDTPFQKPRPLDRWTWVLIDGSLPNLRRYRGDVGFIIGIKDAHSADVLHLPRSARSAAEHWIMEYLEGVEVNDELTVALQERRAAVLQQVKDAVKGKQGKALQAYVEEVRPPIAPYNFVQACDIARELGADIPVKQFCRLKRECNQDLTKCTHSNHLSCWDLLDNRIYEDGFAFDTIPLSQLKPAPTFMPHTLFKLYEDELELWYQQHLFPRLLQSVMPIPDNWRFAVGEKVCVTSPFTNYGIPSDQDARSAVITKVNDLDCEIEFHGPGSAVSVQKIYLLKDIQLHDNVELELPDGFLLRATVIGFPGGTALYVVFASDDETQRRLKQLNVSLESTLDINCFRVTATTSSASLIGPSQMLRGVVPSGVSQSYVPDISGKQPPPRQQGLIPGAISYNKLPRTFTDTSGMSDDEILVKRRTPLFNPEKESLESYQVLWINRKVAVTYPEESSRKDKRGYVAAVATHPVGDGHMLVVEVCFDTEQVGFPSRSWYLYDHIYMVQDVDPNPLTYNPHQADLRAPPIPWQGVEVLICGRKEHKGYHSRVIDVMLSDQSKSGVLVRIAHEMAQQNVAEREWIDYDNIRRIDTGRFLLDDPAEKKRGWPRGDPVFYKFKDGYEPRYDPGEERSIARLNNTKGWMSTNDASKVVDEIHILRMVQVPTTESNWILHPQIRAALNDQEFSVTVWDGPWKKTDKKGPTNRLVFVTLKAGSSELEVRTRPKRTSRASQPVDFSHICVPGQLRSRAVTKESYRARGLYLVVAGPHVGKLGRRIVAGPNERGIVDPQGGFYRCQEVVLQRPQNVPPKRHDYAEVLGASGLFDVRYEDLVLVDETQDKRSEGNARVYPLRRAHHFNWEHAPGKDKDDQGLWEKLEGQGVGQ